MELLLIGHSSANNYAHVYSAGLEYNRLISYHINARFPRHHNKHELIVNQKAIKRFVLLWLHIFTFMFGMMNIVSQKIHFT